MSNFAASTGLSTRAALARCARAALPTHLCDESGTAALGTALYTLCDPRDLRSPRYVGQTRAPRRRSLQHVQTARLWLPDETPWWVRSQRYRPLYEWIRALYRDERRLPVMLIAGWVPGDDEARDAERALIHRHLREGLPLCNVESRVLGPQIPLL
jgi:hypothetical protein